ncbi:pseudaminic acid cytidylyltransferase [Chlorobium phaeovibrioides]|uniref:Pseudaminic acid cytidylyltransferase n=1 Tax=Chlorobium phaeovibrioides TaxID=1094 RepID=A0A5M8IAN7_CHLPH|nr:pseudaminic acid cytidylyltransferase [Chlorobium phaeovibrioides]KAA6232060.1 pseudaminic acid cytidylyltransferase [Chlorobium phaeovibrioides]
MSIAIIPARGGSKRIPRKNIKMFAGKPMIAHAITTAKMSGLFEHIVVSTDDQEISKIAQKWGAVTPFLRPDELANDYTATVPVIAHAIQSCRALGWYIEQVCCIYPGVPFLQIEDLKGALQLLLKSDMDYSFPVTEFPSAIQRAMKRTDDGKMQPFYPQYELTRTQDLEPAFHDAGQFYWGKAEAWLLNNKVHSNGVGYIIPNWRVVDIDTPEDWDRAELLFEVFNHKKRE